MTKFREEIIGDARLILGDCREILPTLGKVDAVVTDPPYGIGIANNPVRQAHARKDWDASIPDQTVLDLLRAMSDVQIIWGGNYFDLPPTQCFLVWDKLQPENFSLAMCEQAWTNLKKPAKKFSHSVTGYSKSHPTQKPVPLMSWCLKHLPAAATVIDPFMGSGTTGVACIQADHPFIGIEMEADYFEIACRRIEDAYKQPRLFSDEPANKPVQSSLFDKGAV
jgi:site-specific DNA-methyltransferase (adenine-specific)/modification methylase